MVEQLSGVSVCVKELSVDTSFKTEGAVVSYQNDWPLVTGKFRFVGVAEMV